MWPLKKFCSALATLVLLTLALSASSGHAETVAYRSAIDELLTIRKISVLPSSDNLDGIYSRPLENHLIELIKSNHRWDLVQQQMVGPILTPEDLAQNPKVLNEMAAAGDTDAVLASRVTKGPNGISIKLALFLLKDQKLLAEAHAKDLKNFEIKSLKEQSSELLANIFSNIPYSGLVLSRQGQRVTINLGQRDGIEPQQIVSVIQIIKATRHPKFDFLVSTEKEIIGKVKLLKVDDTLSFGQIITEKEKGAIQRNAKIAGVDFVTYAPTNSLSGDETSDALMQRPDAETSFGKGAFEWLPQKPPTFGQVGARFGIGNFSGNMQLTSESLDAKDPYNLSVHIDGELWLTSAWTLSFGLKQGILSFDNPKSGSTPSELNASINNYEFLIGHTLRLGADVWGPQVSLLGGFSQYRLFVDDSTPVGLTTTEYSGIKIGASGQYPITPDNSWSAGAEFFFFYKPQFKESTVSSGAKNKNTANQFALFGVRRLAVNLKAIASVDFEIYSTNFSGGGRATSLSHKHTNLTVGVYYMF